MSYSRSSLAAAEREASDRNVREGRKGERPMWRYSAARYPNGTSDVASWPWGVHRYQLGYHKDGSERFAGFVWQSTPHRFLEA